MSDKIIIGEYMHAELLPRFEDRKTDIWVIRASKIVDKHVLGKVFWYFGWRQYTFNPSLGTTFNAGCLKDIAEFLESVNADYRKK